MKTSTSATALRHDSSSFSALRKWLVVLPALALAMAGNAQAADTWAGPSGTTTSPTNGTWDTTTANIWTATSGAGTIPWTNGSTDAIFSGTSVGGTTVTVGTAITANSLIFNSATDNYTLAAGAGTTITLNNGNANNNQVAGSAGIQLANGVTATIGAGLTVNRPGTFSLGASALSGLGVAAGTLNINGTLSMAANNSSIDNGATVIVNAGGLLSNSTGALNLGRGDNNGTAGVLTDTLVANGGTISLASFLLGRGHNNATLTIQNGGTVTLTGNLTFNTSNTNPGTYTDTLNLGSGTLNIGVGAPGNISQGGGTSIFNFNGGTLHATGSQAALIAGLTTANVNAGGAVIDNGGFVIGIAQPLLHGTGGAPDGGLTSQGTGTLTLSGANTYTGVTTVSAGTLKAGVATLGGVSPTSGAFGVNSAVTVASGATLDMGGFNETIGSLADNAGSGGTVTSSVAGPVTLITGGKNTSTSYAGIIQNGTGTVALTKIGTGTQTLAGVNTYSGATSVNGGTLNLTGSNVNSTTTVNSTGTLTGTGTAGPLVLNTGGTIAPGNGTTPSTLTAANLTWNSAATQSSTLSFLLDGASTNTTKLALTNGFFNKGTTGGAFDINLTDTSTLSTIGTYDLVDFTGGSTNFALGDFTQTGSLTYAAGFSGSLVLTGTQLDFVVVPEPGTWAMMLGGFALLVVFQRRKSKS